MGSCSGLAAVGLFTAKVMQDYLVSEHDSVPTVSKTAGMIANSAVYINNKGEVAGIDHESDCSELVINVDLSLWQSFKLFIHDRIPLD